MVIHPSTRRVEFLEIGLAVKQQLQFREGLEGVSELPCADDVKGIS
jgi:hypothetical protein